MADMTDEQRRHDERQAWYLLSELEMRCTLGEFNDSRPQ